MKQTLVIIFSYVIFLNLSLAQQQPTNVAGNNNLTQEASSSPQDPDVHFTCGTEARHDYLMRTDATYRTNFLLHTRQLDSVLNATQTDRRALPPQYTIPVVVHVIHLGEPVGTGSNISDAQIFDAINGLNQHYANSNGQGVDCEIDFCMATQAPNGCPTNGIVRVDGSGVLNYADEGIEYDGTCGANESAIKDLSRWSTLDYYNIWVVHDICGNWAGYAYYPNGGDLDGTVIGSAYMTGNGKTLVHELGHGLNIRHTFHGDGDGNDCPTNTDCTSNGDQICDTPPHKRDDCGATNPCTNEGVWHNSRYNWMSYCSTPSNLGRFTQDQRTRMRAAMIVFPREELLNSIGCVPVDLPEIISDDDPMCSGESKELSATPQGGDFSVASGPGTIQGNELTATGEGTITIQYTTCDYDVFQTIESYQTPEPYFTSTDDPMCSGTTRIISCEPSGGDFILISGPGSINGDELTAEDIGTLEIEYDISINGCSGNTFQEILVVPTPEPEITSSGNPMCVGESRLLSGFPAGGDYDIISGPGSINGNTVIAEGAGTLVIEYIVEENECIGSTTQSISVNSTPAPAITSSANAICSGDERVLSALPAGGIFSVLSGPGVITGDTLHSNGAGDIHIQYTVSQNGCVGISTQTITSQQTPVAGFNNPEDHFCMGDSIVLSADPPGGIFQLLSGPGALNVNILTGTGEGNLLISYTITQNGCTGNAEKLITSVEVPQPVFTMDTSDICNGSSRTLTATPEGGVFSVLSGPGSMENNTLTPIGVGFIKLHYVVSRFGCTGETNKFIFSKPSPHVQFIEDSLSMCVGEENQIVIEPVTSELILIAGPGALDSNLLTSTGTGMIELVGQFEENGCVGIDTLLVSSNPFPSPELTLIDTAICNGYSIQLSANPSGGTFEILSGPGSINQNILTAISPGTVQIVYTVEENNCTGNVQGQILVIDPVTEVTVLDSVLMSVSSAGVFQWLDCENNFEPLPGETNNTLIVTQTGTYALVNGIEDCIDTSACVLVEITGISKGDSNQQLRIYPNPVNDLLFLEYQGLLPKHNVIMSDMQGKLISVQPISQQHKTNVDVSSVAAGVYILTMDMGVKGVYNYRFVKL